MLTDKEILRLYWGGLTIKRLTEMVRSTEDCTLREARARVERVIYEDCMAKKKPPTVAET